MKSEALNDRLKKFIKPTNNDWMEDAKWSEENRDWMELSGRIAARVLTVMKARKMTQVELASLLGVTPQNVNKMLRGNVKFQIDTICKLQNCLGVKLIEVPAETGLEYEVEGVETETSSMDTAIFEQYLFEASQLLESGVTYTSERKTRLSTRKYVRPPSDCKVINLNVEQNERFTEAV